MPVTISGSGTITGIATGGLPDGSIAAGDLASTLDLTGKTVTLPAGTGGKILQVVQGSTSTEVVVNTTTYTDTGLSASITPTSNTSKILVLVNQSFYVYRTSTSIYTGMRIYRDSTIIHEPVSSAGPLGYEFGTTAGGVSSIGLYGRGSISVLDSPASTSALTYKTSGQPYVTTNAGQVKFQPSDSINGTSYIILLEVAA